MSKDGKSCLATALAMAVATGEPFLGKQVRHGPVLWCAYEESRSERQRVLREWDQEPEGSRITHKNLKIDTDAGMEAISREVFSTGA
ncbi:AAA family ATPase, partial [Streptomyces scabiei]